MGVLSFAGTPDANDTVTFCENFVRGTRSSNSRSSATWDRATVLLFILLVLYSSRWIAWRAIKTPALLQPMTEVIGNKYILLRFSITCGLLTFKAQPTNVFFATVSQMFGGSFQLPAIAERAVIKSLSTVQTTKRCSAVVGSWEEPPNIWLMVAKSTFVGWALNFRVRVLLKSAIILTKRKPRIRFCCCASVPRINVYAPQNNTVLRSFL